MNGTAKFAYVLEAVVLLASDLKDDEVVARLVRDGCAVARAWKLIAVVPMAFARAVFGPVGVIFEDHYVVMTAGGPVPSSSRGSAPARRQLTLDPIYQRALHYAQRLAAAQRTMALFQVLRRGADYTAIQQLHQKGVPLRDIRLTEPGLVPAG